MSIAEEMIQGSLCHVCGELLDDTGIEGLCSACMMEQAEDAQKEDKNN